MREWMYMFTILDLGTRRRWEVCFTSLSLYPQGRSPRYTWNMRLGGPESRYGRCGEKKNLTPAGNQTPDFQLIARRYSDWAIATSTLATDRIVKQRTEEYHEYSLNGRPSSLLQCRLGDVSLCNSSPLICLSKKFILHNKVRNFIFRIRNRTTADHSNLIGMRHNTLHVTSMNL
jgi:hypothetical protein